MLDHLWSRIPRAASCTVLEPVLARELVCRISFRYTPNHGGWLGIAGNELRAMTRQCLNGHRMGDIETLRSEIAAWTAEINGRQWGVDWKMKAGDPSYRLKSVYLKT